jgi:uncharacterized membrane protein
VRWTTDGDTIDIEHSLGEYRAAAHAASIDLGVVFGSISSVDGNDGNLFRWTKDDGMMDLGTLREFDNERWSSIFAYDATPDGKIAVGAHSAKDLPALAFRWTSEAGLTQIAEGRAVAVSDDGRIVVGDSLENGVFRWSDEELETLTTDGRASDVSADGSVVVGWDYDMHGIASAFRRIHGRRHHGKRDRLQQWQ